jgi:hypothetical protein
MIGSNWKKLKEKVINNDQKSAKKNARSLSSSSTQETIGLDSNHIPQRIKDKYVGLDCEMVGIGPNGTQSALARCCVVDFDGNVVYDEFVRPPGFVTDFRTKYSGVRKQDLRRETAVTLQSVNYTFFILILVTFFFRYSGILTYLCVCINDNTVSRISSWFD